MISFQHRMHDLIIVAGALRHTSFFIGSHYQFTTKHSLVELYDCACSSITTKIWIKSDHYVFTPFKSFLRRSQIYHENKNVATGYMPGIIEFPTVVKQAMTEFGAVFANEPERVHFAEYLTGLLVAERKTVKGISREFAETADQSCLNR